MSSILTSAGSLWCPCFQARISTLSPEVLPAMIAPFTPLISIVWPALIAPDHSKSGVPVAQPGASANAGTASVAIRVSAESAPATHLEPNPAPVRAVLRVVWIRAVFMRSLSFVALLLGSLGCFRRRRRFRRARRLFLFDRAGPDPRPQRFHRAGLEQADVPAERFHRELRPTLAERE